VISLEKLLALEKAQCRLETLEKDFRLLGLWKRPGGFGKSQRGSLASCVYIFFRCKAT
jgi:hypothetical protein